MDILTPEDPDSQEDAITVDLSDGLTAKAVFAARHPVTVLVNNVGMVRPALFDDVSLDDFETVLNLNTRTP